QLGRAGPPPAVAGMLSAPRWLGTWRQCVASSVALTEFARAKFIAGGLPAAKIAVKPTFCAVDPGMGDGAGGYALFVGRLSVEKGIATLMDAWPRLRGRVPLTIVGDGPLAARVQEFVGRANDCQWLGQQPKER